MLKWPDSHPFPTRCVSGNFLPAPVQTDIVCAGVGFAVFCRRCAYSSETSESRAKLQTGRSLRRKTRISGRMSCKASKKLLYLRYQRRCVCSAFRRLDLFAGDLEHEAERPLCRAKNHSFKQKFLLAESYLFLPSLLPDYFWLFFGSSSLREICFGVSYCVLLLYLCRKMHILRRMPCIISKRMLYLKYQKRCV